jgi:hypothetical protein
LFKLFSKGLALYDTTLLNNGRIYPDIDESDCQKSRDLEVEKNETNRSMRSQKAVKKEEIGNCILEKNPFELNEQVSKFPSPTLSEKIKEPITETEKERKIEIKEKKPNLEQSTMDFFIKGQSNERDKDDLSKCRIEYENLLEKYTIQKDLLKELENKLNIEKEFKESEEKLEQIKSESKNFFSEYILKLYLLIYRKESRGPGSNSNYYYFKNISINPSLSENNRRIDILSESESTFLNENSNLIDIIKKSLLGDDGFIRKYKEHSTYVNLKRLSPDDALPENFKLKKLSK